MKKINTSLSRGYYALSAWSDLLDRINVFPVADGDTGTNLRISLAPFSDANSIDSRTAELIIQNATGNSGNIAAAFFREFSQVTELDQLVEYAKQGRDQAWKAIASPQEGTMLSVFDSLVSVLQSHWNSADFFKEMRLTLQDVVLKSSEELEGLREADVVDSGALAVYLFFEGYFQHLTDQPSTMVDLYAIFPGKLEIRSDFEQEDVEGFCVNLLMEMDKEDIDLQGNLDDLGNSVVSIKEEKQLKVHLHTDDPQLVQEELEQYGNILQWQDEELTTEIQPPSQKTNLHIITDSAGSLTRQMATKNGISLLDSYIIVGNDSRPESLYEPEMIYHRLLKGEKITTAQASNSERRQHYESLTQQYGECLYLCVGSVFTGNYDAAMAWKEESDTENHLTVLDTGAASGRLALIALLTARKNLSGASAEETRKFAKNSLQKCQEYVFIDKLKYLVRGGRVSRPRGYFGDLLRLKPIVSPTSSGVEKVGMVRSKEKQLDFAVDKLINLGISASSTLIILQYSDNRRWVESVVKTEFSALFPKAEIILSPLSLTSGVHMGPGTWSLAFSPV
jgi:uncharacterized protein